MTARRFAALFVVGAFISWVAVLLLPERAEGHIPLRCRGHFSTMTGTDSDDVLVGTPQRDIIRGKGGDDSIFGLSGNDLICGGRGEDEIVGGDGMDHARGGGGEDTCSQVEHRRSCVREGEEI